MIRRVLTARRHASALLAIASVCAMLGAFLQNAAAAQVLRRGTANEPRTLDPQYVQGNAGAAVMYDMFEGLLAFDAGGEIVPGMAASWNVSPDGKVYTF